ncbi:MAG: Cupredoxin-like domain [Thermoplasmata archaeon]|jgi:heme/copper-type cytochrome/quinol oxidase subunit 2|nr:Cupredoxin-like domain [Thermoplasmata archaeon]
MGWSLSRTFLVVALILPVVVLTLEVRGFAWLGFGPVPFFLIPMALLGLVAIRWPNRWMLLAGGILAFVYAISGSIAALTGSDPANGDPGALRPDRFNEYTFWWLSVVAGVGALVAAIAHARRAPASPTPLGIAAVAVCVAVFLAGVATAYEVKAYVPPAQGSVVAAHADAELNLTARDDAWEPASLHVPVGKLVLLHVRNAGSADHVFDQPESGARVDLAPGSTHDVWLKLDAAGSLQYYCELHSAKGGNGKWTGMVGTLDVA